MSWVVIFHEEFAPEFEKFSDDVKDAIFVRAGLLELEGPQLMRPYADTLKGSDHTNMKELRLTVNKAVWRVAFAFDPKRDAILLVAGNKAGRDEQRFYRELIKVADARFTNHLDRLDAR